MRSYAKKFIDGVELIKITMNIKLSSPLNIIFFAAT